MSASPEIEEDAAADPRLEAAVLGREIEIFLREHPAAQLIIERAREDLERAQAALVTVDPQDAGKIAQLQLDARVANRVRGWLRAAIEEGRNAATLLQAERDEHGA